MAVPRSSANRFILEVTQDISTAATIAQDAAVNLYFTEMAEQDMHTDPPPLCPESVPLLILEYGAPVYVYVAIANAGAAAVTAGERPSHPAIASKVCFLPD